MKHTKKPKQANALMKGIGTTAVVAGLGLGLLLPGGTLAKYNVSDPLPSATIKTGAFGLTPSKINLQSAVWKIGSTPIPVDQLNNIALKPGESLTLRIESKAQMRDGVRGTLSLTGYDKLIESINGDPAFTVSASHMVKAGAPNTIPVLTDGVLALDKLVTENVVGVVAFTTITVSMAAASSEIYNDLSVGREKTLDASQIVLSLTHN